MQLPTFGQAGHTLTLIAAQNPEQGHVKTLHSGPLTDLVQAIMQGTLPERELFRKFLGLSPIEKILLIDYGMTLEQMTAAGNYDWKNDDLNTKNFPIKGEGKVEVEWDLLHLNRNVSSEDALVEIGKDSDPSNPWIAGKTEHVLAFGAAYPEEQRKYPIIGLGSVAKVDGLRHVPCLTRYGSGCYLRLAYFAYVWAASYRFLRVRRKVSVAPASNPSV